MHNLKTAAKYESGLMWIAVRTDISTKVERFLRDEESSLSLDALPYVIICIIIYFSFFCIELLFHPLHATTVMVVCKKMYLDLKMIKDHTCVIIFCVYFCFLRKLFAVTLQKKTRV